MDENQGLKKILNTFDAFSVVVGAIIGVGIFFTPSQVARLSGSFYGAMIAWGMGGIIALFGAISFAKLGSMYPKTGGQYEILKDAYGGYPSFIYVFCNITAIQAGSAAVISLVCIANLWLVGSNTLPSPFLRASLAGLLILVLVIANVVGVKYGALIQDLTVIWKFLVIAGIITLSFFAQNKGSVGPEKNENILAFGIFSALVPALFSFGGWQHALWIGGEIKQGEKKIPFAIITGVLSVILCYMLINFAYFSILGYEGVSQSKAIAADSVYAVLGNIGKQIVALAVALSAFGVLNAQFLSGPRLVYAMARKGAFFSIFGVPHKRFFTPYYAIILLGVMAIFLLFVAGENAVSKILTGVVFIDCIFFILTALSLIIIKKTFLMIPVLFSIGELLVMIGAYLDTQTRISALIGIAWVLFASVFYFFRKIYT